MTPLHFHICAHLQEALEVEEVALGGRIYGDAAASLVAEEGGQWVERGSPSHGEVGELVWAS